MIASFDITYFCPILGCKIKNAKKDTVHLEDFNYYHHLILSQIKTKRNFFRRFFLNLVFVERTKAKRNSYFVLSKNC